MAINAGSSNTVSCNFSFALSSGGVKDGRRNSKIDLASFCKLLTRDLLLLVTFFETEDFPTIEIFHRFLLFLR